MIDPQTATFILLGFLVIFGIIIPIINIKFEKYISLRWYVIVVVLGLLVGVVINFSGLDEESRHIVMIGSLIICGAFVLMRTLEKWAFHGWSLFGNRDIKLSAEKGDIKASVDLSTNASHEDPCSKTTQNNSPTP